MGLSLYALFILIFGFCDGGNPIRDAEMTVVQETTKRFAQDCPRLRWLLSQARAHLFTLFDSIGDDVHGSFGTGASSIYDPVPYADGIKD
jgi:hypothetical protein